MYTGTLIEDLMKTVERVEYEVRRQRFIEDAKLPVLLDVKDPAVVMNPHIVLAGAA